MCIPWLFAVVTATAGLLVPRLTLAQGFNAFPATMHPGPIAHSAAAVDFGPNVSVFDPSTSPAAIQAKLDAIFKVQETNQFGPDRHVFLFKPGTYTADANIGFNTQILGLGRSPDDVVIKGNVRAEADWFHDNGTCNFWRGAENLAVIPSDRRNRWAVSQAAPFRRMHIRGDLQLDPRGHGWSSGGFVADTKVDGKVSSGSQQQYLSRNDEFGSWSGSVWNMVFIGLVGAPPPHFPNPSHTVIAQTPLVREKPFLCVDAVGNYQVFVPALRSNSTGTSWSGRIAAGVYLPLSHFFIVKPGATALDMSTALSQGYDLLITPGIYHLDQPLKVTRPDTVLLGLGFATLVPDGGVTAVQIADVDGVKVAGLLIDAGPVSSPTLLEVGAQRSLLSHAANPTSLHDVFVRVGGAGVGRAAVSMLINSNNVIVDHTWLWRADHGQGVGWTVNTADYGLVVNGDDVTIYGLFSEHYQKNSVLWNGNGGRTYMFQNEMPYDPPNQEAWMNGAKKGFPAWKVADTVTTHEAWGVGSYCYFNVDQSVVSECAFEVPDRPGVRLHNALTVSLGGKGMISNVVNHVGGPTTNAKSPRYLAQYPDK